VSFLECKSLSNVGDGKPVQFDENVFTKQKNSAGQYCHNNGYSMQFAEKPVIEPKKKTKINNCSLVQTDREIMSL